MTDDRHRSPGADHPAADLEVLSERVPPSSQADAAIVAGTAIVGALCAAAFAVTLLLGMDLVVYGTLLAVAFLLLAVAVRRYFVSHYPDVDGIEPRTSPAEPATEPGQERGGLAVVTPVGRRPLITRILVSALGVLGLAFLAPVSSLGPSPGDRLRRTAWQRGLRLVTGDGDPVRADDLEIGSVLTAWPEGAVGSETAAVVVLRLRDRPAEPTNAEWVVADRVVAYSKVCTHAGCPVALYRERDGALFCPCHQSTFDANRGAVPTFGPAARALPQLPLGADADGHLVALGDFEAQVGPAFG